MKNNYRLKYKIELYKNGQRIQSTFSTKKRKIVHCSRGKIYESGLLKVMLGNSRNVINEAPFKNVSELQWKLAILTEKAQINYIGGEDGKGI